MRSASLPGERRLGATEQAADVADVSRQDEHRQGDGGGELPRRRAGDDEPDREECDAGDRGERRPSARARQATHTTARAATTAGWSTTITPAPVAMPLPPRNRRVTGNTWPMIAAAPSAYPATRGSDGPPSHPPAHRPTIVAIAPLAASSTKTSAPLRQPSALVTLEAPGLPEPIAVMSTPEARATSAALGKVPSR